MAACTVYASIERSLIIIILFYFFNSEGFKHYATLCKETGMAVSRLSAQRCHVVKLHLTAGSEQRFAEKASLSIIAIIIFYTPQSKCGMARSPDRRAE